MSDRLLRKPNVLAVDDKRTNRVALEAVLGDDYNLLHADSGAQAIAMLQERSDIDVILMDVQMPAMDGFEATAHIKKMPGCEDIPVIFVTAVYNEDPHVKKGYQAGGIDYFSKPFDPEILRKKVGIYAAFRLKADLLRERERQVRVSEELLRVGRKLSGALESLPVGVLIADAEGMIVHTTDEASRVLRSVEAAQSDSYGEILRWWELEGATLRGAHGALSRALARGEASHSERTDIRCCDGSTKSIFVSALPLRRLDGALAGAAVLIQDVRETDRIAEDLEQRVAGLLGGGMQLEQVPPLRS